MGMTAETHDNFLHMLDESEKYRWLAAMVLVSRGKEVRIPPMTKAETYHDRDAHSDEGDLFVGKHTVAVKSSMYDWTCLEDWPFKDYIIGTVKEIDNHKPLWIMDFNKAGTHYGLSCIVTQDAWWTADRPSKMDKANSLTNWCYVCNTEIVEFHEVKL